MSSVPPLLTRSDLARYLGVDLRTLTWWIWALDERKRYYEFEINRRSGGEPRIIRAPIKPIKDLQRCLLPLLARILQQGERPDRGRGAGTSGQAGILWVAKS